MGVVRGLRGRKVGKLEKGGVGGWVGVWSRTVGKWNSKGGDGTGYVGGGECVGARMAGAGGGGRG